MVGAEGGRHAENLDVRSRVKLDPNVAYSVRRSFRVLFVGSNHLPHVGGAEISTHHLAAELVSRGHSVAVLTQLTRRSASGFMDWCVSGRRRGTRQHADSRLGYPTIRSIRPLDGMDRVLEDFRPDAVIATATDPAFATRVLGGCHRHPTLLYVRGAVSVPIVRSGAHFDLVLANSNFIANSVRQHGVEALFLPSLFPLDLYRVATAREKVLFVNPIPKKGLEIALQLAKRRPDIPFVFALSWRIQRPALRRLRRHARDLANVEIRKATRQPAALFRDCRLLLVPSRWPEAWSRVVSEAQISGIPALAARVGGLPESVGPGGILVEPRAAMDDWVEALSALWDDPDEYERLASLALDHSKRPEMAVGSVVERFEQLLQRAIEEHRTSCL